MEAVNSCLKNIVQAKDLIRKYLDQNDIENSDMLKVALDLLEVTEESLIKNE